LPLSHFYKALYNLLSLSFDYLKHLGKAGFKLDKYPMLISRLIEDVLRSLIRRTKEYPVLQPLSFDEFIQDMVGKRMLRSF
jgi:hypothetical protein